MLRRRVLVAHAGGTIGMRRGSRGYQPSPGHLQELLAEVPEVSHGSMPQVEVFELEPLLDSSDMVPADWLKIARVIEERYQRFDGFVILHGTDTMAYTASALSFLLEDLAKPVILTGSQIPLAEPRSDARENLVTSLMLAARDDIHEVAIYFHGRLLRGNRATKISSVGFDAFYSPNEMPLAEVGVDVAMRVKGRSPGRGGSVRVHPLSDVVVAAVRLFPGIRPELLRNLMLPPVQGVVLETYGAGNAPSRDASLMRVIAEATRRGVVIVNCTQCLRGRVDMNGYAGGAALLDAGVVSGADMTPEAALTKLIWLLSGGMDPERVRELIGRDLRGELTPAK